MGKRDFWIAWHWEAVQRAAVFFTAIIALNAARFIGYFIAGENGWYWAGWISLLTITVLLFTVVGRLIDRPWPPFRTRIKRLIQSLQESDGNAA